MSLSRSDLGTMLENIQKPSSIILIATFASAIQGLYMYHRCGVKKGDGVWLSFMLIASLALVAGTAMKPDWGTDMSDPDKFGLVALSILYLATTAVTNRIGNKCKVSQGTAQWLSSNTTIAACSVLFAIFRKYIKG